MKMKLVKIVKKDASSMTELEAEKRFYSLYKPFIEMAKKSAQKMWQVRYDLHDSIRNKQAEFDKEIERLVQKGAIRMRPTIPADYKVVFEDFPYLKKMNIEIGKMKNMENHIEFMLKEIGPEILSMLK